MSSGRVSLVRLCIKQSSGVDFTNIAKSTKEFLRNIFTNKTAPNFTRKRNLKLLSTLSLKFYASKISIIKSTIAKVALRDVDEINPGVSFTNILQAAFLSVLRSL